MSDMPSVQSSRNWIPDVNRFGIPKPPDWFLKVLWDQDAALVLLPSRQSPKYILARRRDFSKIMAGIVRTLTSSHRQAKYLDADMLESRNLVKVDAITSIRNNVFDASWMVSSPEIMKDLRDRDMWAAGGADKYIEKIELQEQLERDQQRTKMLDDLDHRARDSWRSYQARTGRRNQHANGAAVQKNRAIHA